MTKDVAPALYDAVKGDFEKNMKSDRIVRRIGAKIDQGTATWRDAYDYGVAVSDCLRRSFRKNIKESELPNGRMYYNIAERVVRPMLEEVEAIMAEATKKIVEAQNERAGIGLKSI